MTVEDFSSTGNAELSQLTPRKAVKPTATQREGFLPRETALAIVDYALVISLVFGGCCTNAWSLETLLKDSSGVGSALTFSQMSFIAAQALPSFITFQSDHAKPTTLPRLKPRAVPLSTWLVQVLLLVCMSLLNNWAFAYRVPLAVQIVVRSSGLAMSMLFGYLLLHKTYSGAQIMAVLLVTAGVTIATLSGPSSSSRVLAVDEIRQYSIGILMLALATVLAGYYGMLQERTYKRYGPHWKEGVFYTHLFSLPTFIFLVPDVRRGVASLSKSSSTTLAGIPSSYLVLALNLVTQLLCTSSVNKLSSAVSSVTTNLVLTARKALSLCISVWWFGNGWNKELGCGALMVFVGTVLYTLAGSKAGSREAGGIKKDKAQ